MCCRGRSARKWAGRRRVQKFCGPVRAASGRRGSERSARRRDLAYCSCGRGRQGGAGRALELKARGSNLEGRRRPSRARTQRNRGRPYRRRLRPRRLGGGRRLLKKLFFRPAASTPVTFGIRRREMARHVQSEVSVPYNRLGKPNRYHKEKVVAVQ